MPRSSANWSNKAYVLEEVEKAGSTLEYASRKLRRDKELVKAAVRRDGSALFHASKKLRNNEEVVKAAVEQDGMALWFASDEMKCNKKVVNTAVNQDAMSIRYASDELKDDNEVVMAAVNQDAMSIRYASDELKDNKDVVMAAVNKDAMSIRYASDELKDNIDVVMAAVKQNGLALLHASEKLRGDKDVVQAAAEQNEYAVKFATGSLRGSKMKKKENKRDSEDLRERELLTDVVADFILSSESPAPFTVGLLGHWGTGKSYTSNCIKSRIRNVMKVDVQKKDFGFCGHIYTIDFNAWTFSKADLWSSLMFKIFSDLSEQLDLEAHIREHMGDDFCLQGYDLIGLRESLNSDDLRDAFKEYLAESYDGKYCQQSGKASKELIDVLNRGYEEDVKELPQKMKKLEEINKKLKRKQLGASLTGSVAELFREELKHFRENNPQDENISHVLNNLSHFLKFRKLLVGGLLRSPVRALLFLVMVAVSILIAFGSVLFQKWWKDEYVSVIVAPLISMIAVLANTFKKTRDSFLGLGGVTAAIAVVDEAESERLAEEMETGGSLIQTKRALEKEISTMKRRRWLVEGDSLHDQVMNRFDSSKYEDKLGVVHQAQLDLQMLGNAIESSVRHDKHGTQITEPYEKEGNEDSGFEGYSAHFEEHGCIGVMLHIIKEIYNVCAFVFDNIKSLLKCICNQTIGCILGQCRQFLFGKANEHEMKAKSRIFSSWSRHQKIKDMGRNIPRPKQEVRKRKRFPRGKPRIIVFVDDLDRCPPRKVIEVIEALHLLLNYSSVFVSVVSVDARYATRALEKEYTNILIKNSGFSGIQYLEKIIHLPFSVPPMTSNVMADYFQHQLCNDEANVFSTLEEKTNQEEPATVEAEAVKEVEVDAIPVEEEKAQAKSGKKQFRRKLSTVMTYFGNIGRRRQHESESKDLLSSPVEDLKLDNEEKVLKLDNEEKSHPASATVISDHPILDTNIVRCMSDNEDGDASSSNAGSSGWSSSAGIDSMNTSSADGLDLEKPHIPAIATATLPLASNTTNPAERIDKTGTNDDINIPPVTRDNLDSAIEAGDWAAVGATAALLAAASDSQSYSSKSEQHTGTRSRSRSSVSSLDVARAAELDHLVDAGDWEGVVLAAAKYEGDESKESLPSASISGSDTRSNADTAGQTADSSIASSKGLKRQEYRAIVEDLVQRVVPEEIQNVDEMMLQFRGHEDELVETLRTMQERAVAQKARNSSDVARAAELDHLAAKYEGDESKESLPLAPISGSDEKKSAAELDASKEGPMSVEVSKVDRFEPVESMTSASLQVQQVKVEEGEKISEEGAQTADLAETEEEKITIVKAEDGDAATLEQEEKMALEKAKSDVEIEGIGVEVEEEESAVAEEAKQMDANAEKAERDEMVNDSDDKYELASSGTKEYKHSNVTLKFSNEEVQMIAKAGKDARISPRSGAILSNVFKILKLVWARNENPPTDDVKKAILLLLCTASSYPSTMGKVLADLDGAFDEKNNKTNLLMTLDEFVKTNLEGSVDQASIARLTKLNWGKAKLEEITHRNVRVLRTFSFVGYVTDTDDKERKEIKADAVRIFRSDGYQECEVTIYMSNIPKARKGLDILNQARKIAKEEKSSLFQFILGENEIIRYRYRGKNPTSANFRNLEIDEILGGDDETVQIKMTINVKGTVPEDVPEHY